MYKIPAIIAPITGAKIKTTELYAGSAAGYEYEKYTREKVTKEDGTRVWGNWVKQGTTTFTEDKGATYYPNNNSNTSNVYYKRIK